MEKGEAMIGGGVAGGAATFSGELGVAVVRPAFECADCFGLGPDMAGLEERVQSVFKTINHPLTR